MIDQSSQARNNQGEKAESAPQLLEQPSLFAWSTDRDLRFTSCSPDKTNSPFFQGGKAGLATPDLYSCFQTDSKAFPPIDAHLRSLMGESVSYEIEWNGRQFQCQTNPLIDVEGNIAGVAGVALDITKRKQVEAKALEFRMALDSSQDGVYIIDRASMHYIDANETASKALGYTHDELLNMGPHDVRTGVTKETLAQRFDAIIESQQKTATLETLHRRKDGSAFPVEVNLRALESAGKPIILTVARDISERVRYSEAVMNQELRFRALFEQSPDPVYIVDMQANILDVNNKACQELGYSRDELLQMHASDLDHEFRIRGDEKAFWREAPPDKSIIFEAVHHRKDGSTFPVEVHLSAIHTGDQVYLLGISRNLTARKQAEESLRKVHSELETLVEKRTAQLARSENLYRALFNNAGAGIVLTDPYNEFRFLEVNDVFLKRTGYSREELLELTPVDLTYPDDRDNTIAYIQNCLDRAKAKQDLPALTKRYVRKNGEIRWAYTQPTYILDQAGNVNYLLAATIDITEKKWAEEQTAVLLRQNRALIRYLLEVQENERQRLATELHDEVGQWLTAIQLYAQAIWEAARKYQPEICADAEVIQKGAERITRHVHHITNNLRPAELDELGLADGLRHMIRQWQVQYPNISCRLLIEGSLDDLGYTISIAVFRIVQDCLANVARHAGASRVKVELHCFNRDHASSGWLTLTVEDDGVGQDYMHPMAGLGLPGVRERVLAIDGELSLSQPQPGKGLRLRIRIPIQLSS